jgi:DNA-binding NarL/FixJ family response regulator
MEEHVDRSPSEFMNRARILICIGHPQWSETITAFLLPHFEVAGAVHDGSSLLAESLRLEADVVVIEVAMPHLDGIAAVRQLRLAGSKSKVVFVTLHTEKEYLNACIAEGAVGFIPKSEIREHLIPAIHAALNGQTYFRDASTE